MTVLDMNRFAPDHPGGWVNGFAIQWYCKAEVECTENSDDINYSRSSIIENFVSVFKKTVGYTAGFRIKASDHQHKHVGLGSTSTVMIAVATAMNFFFQAEDGIRDTSVTGVQTCALPI